MMTMIRIIIIIIAVVVVVVVIVIVIIVVHNPSWVMSKCYKFMHLPKYESLSIGNVYLLLLIHLLL